MKSEEIVQKYLYHFGAGNIEEAISLVAEDAVWRVDGSPLVPTVGILTGKAQIRQWLNAFPYNFTPVKFAIDTMLFGPEHVMITGYFRHQTHMDSVYDGNGKRMIDGPFALHFIVKNEKIIRYQIFEDSLAISKAFDGNLVCQRQTMRVNGVNYAYFDMVGPQVDEDKSVLLFLHGLFMSSSLFAAQIQRLSQSYRCVALDMPGHGTSTYSASGWTLESLAKDIATLIQELRLGKVSLIGHSQGGMVGLRIAITQPELLHSLVLINCSARAEAIERHAGWQELRAKIFSDEPTVRKAAFFAIQQRTTSQEWLLAHPREAAQERASMLAADRLGFMLAVNAAVLQRQSIVSSLKTIATPTMVISGKLDEATTPEMGLEIASAIPGATFVCIEGSQHHSPKETPEEVTQHIEQFLNIAVV